MKGRVRMSIRKLQSRLLYRSLDAAVTAPLRPERPAAAYLRSVLSPRSSNYDRVGSFFRLVNRVVPSAERRVFEKLCSTDRLPFPDASIELIGFGSGATVFLLRNGSFCRVLKIYRRTVGQDRRRLPDLARTYREKYDTAVAWYGEDIVCPARYLVLHGPILGRPAVACVQEYLDGEKADWFEGFSDDELLRRMTDDGLRRQFHRFATRTLEIYTAERRCVDFLGEGNLLLLNRGGIPRLRLIDYGVFDIDALEKTSPSARSIIEERMARLARLLKAVERPS